jgi:hypothetical protein
MMFAAILSRFNGDPAPSLGPARGQNETAPELFPTIFCGYGCFCGFP